MIASGAMTFFFDFDIFSNAPISTRLAVPLRKRLAVVLLDVVGLAAIRRPAVIGLVANHALREQARERLVDIGVAQSVQPAREEARVEQMQDRVLDAADILIDRQPVVRRLAVDRRFRCGVAEAREVPGRIDEGIQRVGLAHAPCRRSSGKSTCFHVGW